MKKPSTVASPFGLLAGAAAVVVPLTVATGITLAPAVAHATPFVPRDRLVMRPGTPAILERWTVPGITPADVTARHALIASFEKSLQYTTPCADAGAGVDAGLCDFGGEIEVQTGPGHAIIESDNTQESIWIWSRQKELAGDGSFAPQIANAFEFLNVFPGYLKWQETGDPGPDYYSVYNCGWGVRAVVEYEAAFGDTSHHTYGATCAAHIAANAATVANGGTLIDVATASFAAAGLMIWGQAVGDTTLQQTAASIGAIGKAWIDATPANVSAQTWAVTGAAVYDGVIGSYMVAHPTELASWVTTTAPNLGGWIDESTPASPNDWTDWRNAHNAWNMLGQFDTGLVLGEDGTGAHNAVAVDIYSKLVAQDVQGNGGVPGSQQRENAMEGESWITAYLDYFGVRPFLADMALDGGVVSAGDGGAPDAGVSDAGVADAASVDAGGADATVQDGGTVTGHDAGLDATGARDATPIVDPVADGSTGGTSGSSGSSGGCAIGPADGEGWSSLPLVGLAIAAVAGRRGRKGRRSVG